MTVLPEPTVCEVCGQPLADEPWQRGLDGCGAHLACLEPLLDEEEHCRD